MTERCGYEVIEAGQGPGGAAMMPCVHHWRLPAPAGPICMGICKLCGAEREFSNEAPDRQWERSAKGLIEQGRIAMEYLGQMKRYSAW